MSKIRPVRVTNPELDIQGLVIEPAKTAVAFGAGAVAGSFVTSPINDALDARISSDVGRGAAKLAAGAVLIGLIAVAGEKSKSKSLSTSAPLFAAAALGAGSGLIYSSIQDFTGRTFVGTDTQDFIEESEDTAQMQGTILSPSQLLAAPALEGELEMSGWGARGSRFRSASSF